MPASTWSWSGSAWTLLAGAGNGTNLPQAGDTEIIAAGTLDVTAAVTGSGAFQIGHDALLQLDGSLSAGQSIQFNAVSELILNSPGTVLANTITGLSVGDQIDLKLGSGVFITNVSQSGSITTIATSVGSYQLTNVSFAAGSPVIWHWGTDLNNGDQFISLLPTTATWTGVASTDLGTAGNWSNAAVPGGFSQLSFAGNGGPVTGAANGWAAFFGTYGTSSFGTWTLNNAALTTSADGGPINFGESLGFYQNVIVNGGTINAGSGLGYITAVAGATVTAQGGTQVTTLGDDIGLSGQTGSLALTGAGTTWTEQTGAALGLTTPGNLLLGAGGAGGGQTGGAGFLTVTNSASLATGGGASLGAYAGSTGSATISSGGVWSIGSGLSVGQSGSGTLSVSNASVTDAGSATFGQTGSGTLAVNGGSFTASGQLILGQFTGGFGTATVTSGLINAVGGIQVGASGTGLMTVGSGGILQLGTSFNAVGSSAGSDGILLIQAGGTVISTLAPSTASTLQIGQNGGNASQAAANGAVIVSGLGARLDLNTHGITVGALGGGALTVANGATVAAGVTSTAANALTAAGQAGGNAQVAVSGTGSVLSLAGIASFGQQGNAVLSVTSGGVLAIGNAGVSAPRLQIGVGGGSIGGGTGTATVTSNGTITDTGAINIGGNGSSGSLGVSGGGSVQAAGTVTVGTALLSLGTVYGGSGALNIGAGGTLSLTAATVASPLLVIAGKAASITGASDLSSGAVTVSGTGALLNTGGNAIAVGQAGFGSLTVQQHGTVLAGIGFASNSAITVGTTLGASGTVAVTDTGSTLTAVGQVTVGLGGQGSLVVSNAGTAITGGNTIDANEGIKVAVSSGASGSVLVTGTGSLLSNTGRFVIGDGAVGSLAIAAGANVITSPGTVVGLAGAIIANTAAASGASASVIGASWQIGGTLVVG